MFNFSGTSTTEVKRFLNILGDNYEAVRGVLQGTERFLG